MQCAELSCRYKTQTFTRPGQRAEQFQELKICVSPQFRAIDPPNPTRGFIRLNQNVRFATAACHPKCQNVRFATAACAKMYEMSASRRQSPAAYKNHRFTTVSNVRPAQSDERVPLKNLHFTTVLDIQRARSDERVARAPSKFAFHHSFGRPTITFCVKGCFGNVKNLHFTTVLGVRRSLFALRVASAT